MGTGADALVKNRIAKQVLSSCNVLE